MGRLCFFLALALALSSFPVAEAIRKKRGRAIVQEAKSLAQEEEEEVEEQPDQDKCQKCMRFCEQAPVGMDKCEKMCEKVCGLMDEVDQGRRCGQALLASQKTCGLKGDGCKACVEQGMSKLQDACGEKTDRVAQLTCKGRGQDVGGDDEETDALVQEEVEGEPDQDKCQKCMSFCEKAPFGKHKCKKMCEKVCGLMDEFNQGRKCGRALFAFKKTCGRKGDSCEECVEQGMSKLQDACGEKADPVAQLICKGGGQDDGDDEEDMDSLMQNHVDDESDAFVEENRKDRRRCCVEDEGGEWYGGRRRSHEAEARRRNCAKNLNTLHRRRDFDCIKLPCKNYREICQRHSDCCSSVCDWKASSTCK